MTQMTGTIRLDRDVVLVEGAEAIDFVHGQVSQDVASLAVGESVLSFLLHPQGKVEALMRISRLGEDSLVLDLDAGQGTTMVESLGRFKLRTRVEFSTLDWSVTAVLGADSAAVADATGTELVVSSLLGAAAGSDLIGPDPALDGVPEMTRNDYEYARVRAGFPIMGVDINESSIPNESGILESAVSFTKGCYRGQELVERINSRGGNRRLLQSLATTEAPPVGSVLMSGSREVGSVTSSASGEPDLVLAYVRGDVDPGDQVTIVWIDDAGHTHSALTSKP